MGKNLKGKELGKGISQRKDGRYVARYIDVTGKRRYIYGDKLSDVRRQLVEAQYKTQNDMVTYNSNMTVDEWYKQWLETYKIGKLKESTLKNIDMAYRKVIKPYIAHKKISKITQLDIQNIINAETNRGLATTTIHSYVVHIRDMMNVAYNNDLIVKNPCHDLNYPKQKPNLKQYKNRRALTPFEEKMFLNVMPNKHWSNLLKLLLFTGLRVGEACALQWKHINIKEGTLRVEQNISSGQISTPKTENSIRTIPLCVDAINLLVEHQKISHNIDDEDFVFCSTRKTYYNPNAISIVLWCFLKANNLSTLNVVPHILRHTFATRCFETGIDPKIIQLYLGHSTITTTLDVYTHIDTTTMKDNISKLSFNQNGVKMVSN